MDIVIPPGIADMGLGGLVALGLLLLAYGKLLPRSVHEDRVSDLKAQIAQKDARNAFLEEALERRDEHVRQLAENNSLAVAAIESIRREAARA